MRPVLLSDVIAAARVLRATPPEEWEARLDALIAAARSGAAHRRRTGRPHPRHGDGSLMGAAHGYPVQREPPLSDAVYRAALIAVLGRAGTS